MSYPNVLLIDDDPSFCLAMSKALRRRGFEVEVVNDSDVAMQSLCDADVDTVAVLDLKMPKRSGLEILRETAHQRSAPVLMLTGHGAVPEAVEAMRAGAYTFLTKPIDAADLEPMILQAQQDRVRNVGVNNFIGESIVAQQIRSLVQRLANVNAPILITGDTGTGKEVVARTLHQQSSRAEYPFIAINMASLSQRDFEVELFGYRSHEVTQETHSYPIHLGLLAEVGQGTLFLDEIDELSLEHQVKLLRLIEDHTYRPLNHGSSQKFSGCFIASSHQPLEQLVQEQKFRGDLFHRLNVYPMYLPPLCERGHDAILILKYWFKQITGLEVEFDEKSQMVLSEHSWRGNAREVVNLARRVSVLCNAREIDKPSCRYSSILVSYSQLEPLLNHQLFLEKKVISIQSSQLINPNLDHLIGGDFPLEDIERAHILKLVERHGNLSQVARILNVNRRTLQRKLKIWGD